MPATFFPDVNVWLALSVSQHSHGPEAWSWLNQLERSRNRLFFSRFTQLSLLRLLTNQSVMGDLTLSLEKAWDVYDSWLNDPRVEFQGEPPGIEAALRDATASFGHLAATKAVGDCYLLAFAQLSRATLVTFDKALYDYARHRHHAAVIPG